jgi:hypothetical protein
MWYKENGLKSGLPEAYSSITIILLLTQCCQIILGKTLNSYLFTTPLFSDLSRPTFFYSLNSELPLKGDDLLQWKTLSLIW